MSCWQTNGFWLTLPAQQLFSALHVIVASLQMAPAGLQALPLSQRPTTSVGFALAQLPTPVWPCTPPNPQQSASPRQTSPVGRQPLGGWQTSTPVLYGAHERLQQLPPQVGTPVMPPASVGAPHTWPATVHSVVPGADGGLHVPSVAPCALVQSPPQHSKSVAQTSPLCVQNEGAPLQVPFRQYFEQQSPWAAQALPAVRQPVFSGAHLLDAQFPPQHWAETVHAWLSDVQIVAPQVPPLQTSVQQS